MEHTNKIDPNALVYIDESGIDDNEVYNYGWEQKGLRLNAMKYGERKCRISIISALNQNKIYAPFVFEGACSRAIFEIYIKEILLPCLQPGQIVVMDNASFHKGGNIESLIHSKQCTILYLPPYSPDLNPIEHYWFSIKHHIKKYLTHVERNIYDAACFAFEKS